jgi:hypothetical protein
VSGLAEHRLLRVLQSLGLNFALAVDLGQLPQPTATPAMTAMLWKAVSQLVDGINVHLRLAFLFSFEGAPSEKLQVLVYNPHEV